jgi:XapX domain-containing protein
MRIVFGFVLALAIGVLYRLTDVPLPAPQALAGASLLVAMSAGIALIDAMVSYR